VKFVYLGQTGLKVSELCLGTITSDRETDENTARRMMDYFVKGGGNFFESHRSACGWECSRRQLEMRRRAPKEK